MTSKPEDDKDEKFDRIAEHLDPLIRRLGSDAAGEVVAAACALIRKLAQAGLDLHDLAERVAHRGYSEEEMTQIHAAAYAKGYAEGSAAGRRNAILLDATGNMFAGNSSNVGNGINGYSWLQVAEHLEQHTERLNSWERSFAISVAEQLRRKGHPSAGQAAKLRDILQQKFAGRI